MTELINTMKQELSKKWRIPVLIVAAIFIIGGLIRACSITSATIPTTLYRIGYDESWYPLSLYGKERNMAGFVTDLLGEISRDTKLRMVLYPMTGSSMYPELDNGNIEGILSFVQPTVSMQDRYLFSDPIYLIGPVLIVSSSNKANSMKSMEGKIVGVKRGSTLIFDEPYPPMQIVPYDNMSTAFSDLVANRIDGIVINALEAFLQLQGLYAKELRVATPPLTKEGLRLIVRKEGEGTQFIELFNEGLKQSRDDGQYNAIRDKWTLFNTDVKPENLPIILK